MKRAAEASLTWKNATARVSDLGANATALAALLDKHGVGPESEYPWLPLEVRAEVSRLDWTNLQGAFGREHLHGAATAATPAATRRRIAKVEDFYEHGEAEESRQKFRDLAAANSTVAQRKTVARKWEQICAQKKWTPYSRDLTAEKIEEMGLVLHNTTPQSALTYLSAWKAYMEQRLQIVFADDRALAYKYAIKSCARGAGAKEKTLPITLEIIQKLDRAASSQDDIAVLRLGMLAFWLLLRLEEAGGLQRDDLSGRIWKPTPVTITTSQGTKIVHQTRFTIPKSKTDQERHGVTVCTICCCEAPVLKALKLKHVRPCPIHCIPATGWVAMQEVKQTVWRTRLHSLCEKAGLPVNSEGRTRALYNLHSFRRGGAQVSLHVLGRDTMEILGRWESSASREYEQDAMLNPASGIVPDWPLLAEELKRI